MKRLADQHREKVALLERQFLQQKQQLLRGTAADHPLVDHMLTLRVKNITDQSLYFCHTVSDQSLTIWATVTDHTLTVE